MSYKLIPQQHRWECDRCGNTHLSFEEKFPIDWKKVAWGDGGSNRTMDLCFSCDGAFETFRRGK